MLLGSGELGKEFTIAAKRAGQYVIACDKYDNAPAMQVADEREVFSMLDGDALTAVVEKHHPDIIDRSPSGSRNSKMNIRAATTCSFLTNVRNVLAISRHIVWVLMPVFSWLSSSCGLGSTQLW